jgi:hypothetical protein
MSDAPPHRRALLVINEKSRQGRESTAAAVEVLERGGLRLRRETCLGPDELSATIRRLAGAIDLVVRDGAGWPAAPAGPRQGLRDDPDRAEHRL